MDYTNDEQIKAPRPLRIIGKIIKWIFLSLVALMLLWLAVCSFFQKGTPRMKQYLWTGQAAERYEALGRENYRVWDLTAYNISSLDKFFFIDHLMYTEDPSQFQFMLRYNRFSSPLKDALRLPGDDNEPFLFLLKDNTGRVYSEYQYLTDSALIYGYYRVVFSDVDISSAAELTVYVYRNNGENTDFESPVDSCTVWYSDGYQSRYTLSSSERNAAMKPTALTAVTVPTKLPSGGGEDSASSGSGTAEEPDSPESRPGSETAGNPPAGGGN